MRCENKTFLQNDSGFLQEISSTAVEVGLGDAAKEKLIHHKSVRSKLPNHHTYAVSAFHQPALVRERHPVGLARLGRAALTQLADLFHRRDHQLDLSLRVDQEGLSLLIVERLGFVCV